jgi:hypothetical protein
MKRCKELLKYIGEKNNLTVKWIKSHSGNEGNDTADTLAKIGANKDEIEIDLPRHANELNSETREWAKNKMVHRWNNFETNKYKHSRLFINDIDEQRTEKLLKFDRKKLRFIISAYTGHSLLTQTLNRFNKNNEEEFCDFCKENTPENMTHLMFECECFENHRFEYLGKDFDEENCISAEPKSLQKFGINSELCKNFYFIDK